MVKEQLMAELAAKEERLEFNGVKVVVRELDCAEDIGIFETKEDSAWRLLVRCVFDEGGKLIFGEEDIPELKRRSLRRTSALVAAVQRVNGLDIEVAEKKS